ncbi:prenyltransferase/squalene oxidase repeat-containing protein [Streptomyces bluensis]|uniref:Prenyltransferase/squalene oxidase repeat-containing protein n=1 Tax=Streptomyces bluensis TaxID=33897 RepID=A0ABW6UD07_9ACTN
MTSSLPGQRAGSPAGPRDLQRAVAECRNRTARHLEGRVDAHGFLQDGCASRIVESALFLGLIRKQASEEWFRHEQEQVTGYLRRACSGTGWQPMLARAALGMAVESDRALAAAFLESFTHFTGVRKRALLQTVFALCALAPYDPRIAALDAPRPGRAATWTRMVLLAMRTLHACAAGGAARVSPAEHAELRRRLVSGTRKVWEGNLLVHLLALHALHALDPGAPEVGAGIRALASCQNPDGGLPFTDSHDLFLTAKAGLALIRAGRSHALVARMAGRVAAGQNPDGGWPYASQVQQCDADSTAVCVEFLRATGPGRYAPHIAAGQAHLRSLAGVDGGFPTYRPGNPSEAEMTAGALIALSHGSTASDPLPVVRPAADWLLDQQSADGTWPRSWTISESSVMERAVHALTRLPAALAGTLPARRVEQALRRAARRLTDTQNSDGGWGQVPGTASGTVSTARALMGLARLDHLPGTRRAADRGIAWLAAARLADGSYPGPPDQVGPRPIPYEFPALAGIYALTALGAWRAPARCGPSSDELRTLHE